MSSIYEKRGIDLLFIQECKIPTNSPFPIGDDYFCITSTDVTETKKPTTFEMKKKKGREIPPKVKDEAKAKPIVVKN